MKRLLACARRCGAVMFVWPARLRRVLVARQVEIVGPDGRTFREIPVNSRDGALRSYLQAEKGAHYEVRVRNSSRRTARARHRGRWPQHHQRQKSDLARTEPMYVLDAWDTQNYAGWRASLEAINEFYFTDWKDSYAEAFGDRSARGVIAVAVFREVPPPPPVYQPYPEGQRARAADARRAPPASAARAPASPTAPRAATSPPARAMATGASIMPCAWNSWRNRAPTAGTSSSTSGARRCAANSCSNAARTIASGMNPVLGFAPPPPGVAEFDSQGRNEYATSCEC